MIYSHPFLIVNKACDEAVAAVMQQLVLANLQVLRTFDLKMSGTTHHLKCACHGHDTDRCDCQFVVLLVYRDNLPPTSLVAHGHDSKTWFTLVDSTEQRAVTRSITAIRKALVPIDVSLNEKDQ